MSAVSYAYSIGSKPLGIIYRKVLTAGTRKTDTGFQQCQQQHMLSIYEILCQMKASCPENFDNLVNRVNILNQQQAAQKKRFYTPPEEQYTPEMIFDAAYMYYDQATFKQTEIAYSLQEEKEALAFLATFFFNNHRLSTRSENNQTWYLDITKREFEPAIYTDSLTWRVNLDALHQNQRKQLFSPPFYTDGGCKICLRVTQSSNNSDLSIHIIPLGFVLK